MADMAASVLARLKNKANTLMKKWNAVNGEWL
jgi:hypothetical protein